MLSNETSELLLNNYVTGFTTGSIFVPALRLAILHTPLIDFYDAPSLKFFSRTKTVYAKDVWKWVRNYRFRNGISKQLNYIAQDLSFDSCDQVIRVHPKVMDDLPSNL